MFELERPQVIVHGEVTLNYTAHDVKWIPATAGFVVLGGQPNGCGIGEVHTLNGEAAGCVAKKHEFGSRAFFRCGTFDASNTNERHLATGDFLGRVQVWDLENTITPIYATHRHRGVVNCIDGVAGALNSCGAPEIVTAGKDGHVMVWDVRQKDDPVATFAPSADDSGATNLPARDCWTVCFGDAYNDAERAIVAGYDNGDLKLFDLRAMSLRWSKTLKNGVTSVQFDRGDIPMNKLIATTLESRLHVYDMRTFHPTRGYAHLSHKAHDSTVWQVKHLPQNREVFVTTGGSGSLCLWNYVYPAKRTDRDADGLEFGVIGQLNQLQNVTLSTQPITSYDWCKQKRGLAVCSSLDQCVRVLIVTKLNTV